VTKPLIETDPETLWTEGGKGHVNPEELVRILSTPEAQKRRLWLKVSVCNHPDNHKSQTQKTAK
jgi:hypothetical protein